MSDIKTSYLGMDLKNPLIAGASGMTSNLDCIKRLEDAGVAAIVTKSLFEEEIQLQRFKFEDEMEQGNYRHPEMITLFPNIEFAGPDEHLMWVGKSKEAVGIPVIGSLNAVNKETWLEYAAQLEQTGIDAIECNLFASPKDAGRAGADIEDEQVELVKELKKKVSVPIALKLSYFYSNPLNAITRLATAGADGVVIFNRLFEPDLDPTEEKHTFPFNFSHEDDYRLPLRYAGLLEGQIKADICCGTGVAQGRTMAKLILAGASAVQAVSAVYRHGFEHVSVMLKDLEAWMNEKEYGSISSFKGRMSKRNTNDPWAYTRTQYAKLLMNPARLVKEPTSR